LEPTEGDFDFIGELQKRITQYEEFEKNRERYPFYVFRVELYPDYSPVEYRITDLPKDFGARLFGDTAHMIIHVVDFKNSEDAAKVAVEMCRLLNKAYGKEI
jgi:hypothetical protein